jgi:hypothetical protein
MHGNYAKNFQNVFLLAFECELKNSKEHKKIGIRVNQFIYGICDASLGAPAYGAYGRWRIR